MNNQTLARDAVLYTLPLYEMARMRSTTSPRRDASGVFADASGGPESTLRWVNLFSHSRQLLGPADRRVVTPNNDTLYTNAWLDLSDGPLLIHAPDTGSRYYVLGFLDFYTNPFAYSGTRSTGTHAQTLFVHGPGWRGAVPAGMIEIASPTDHVWIVGRILATADEDLEPVHVLQNAFQIVSAINPNDQLAGSIFDTGLHPREVLGDPALFLRVVRREMACNPPPAADARMVEEFALVGVGVEVPTVEQLHLIGDALQAVLKELDAPQPSSFGGGWGMFSDAQKSFGNDWYTRALVARGYIGMLGIEEVMYLMAHADSKQTPLDGRRSYQLRFEPGAWPQAAAFWSLTVYRSSDFMLVDNAMHRYSIGDRTPDLEADADGGLTIKISHIPPSSTTNWLPAPSEAFYVALRLYLPAACHLERSFAYPPIVAI